MSSVPDASWNAMLDRDVVIGRADGSTFSGRLLSAEGAAVVIALKDGGRAVSVPKAEVRELWAAPTDTPRDASPRVAPIRVRPRKRTRPAPKPLSPEEADELRAGSQTANQAGIGLMVAGGAALALGLPLWISGYRLGWKSADAYNASCTTVFGADGSTFSVCDEAEYRAAKAKADRRRRIGIPVAAVGMAAVAGGSVALVLGKLRRNRLDRHSVSAWIGSRRAAVTWSVRF